MQIGQKSKSWLLDTETKNGLNLTRYDLTGIRLQAALWTRIEMEVKLVRVANHYVKIVGVEEHNFQKADIRATEFLIE